MEVVHNNIWGGGGVANSVGFKLTTHRIGVKAAPKKCAEIKIKHREAGGIVWKF